MPWGSFSARTRPRTGGPRLEEDERQDEGDTERAVAQHGWRLPPGVGAFGGLDVWTLRVGEPVYQASQLLDRLGWRDGGDDDHDEPGEHDRGDGAVEVDHLRVGSAGHGLPGVEVG